MIRPGLFDLSGGSAYDQGNSITIDGNGNAYVTGYTDSTDFPFTAGAFQTSLGTNASYNAFITKLKPWNKFLVYSTYLGGSKNDAGYSIAIDSVENAYVTGYASSPDFPTTTGAYQTSLATNASYNAFITKLNPAGSALLYSTYLGGDNNDGGYSIATDNIGNAYVTGYASSPDFPTTTGAYQMHLATGASYNAFIAKLNPAGHGAADLLYSTYLGGGKEDYGIGIATDSIGNVYVAGPASSSNFPTTTGAYQMHLATGASYNAFIAKLNPAGIGMADLLYSTFLGGSDYDYGSGIAIDSIGNAYVTGSATSSNFPTTPGAFQTSLGTGASYNAFITKLNPAGSALVYSTYLGAAKRWGIRLP